MAQTVETGTDKLIAQIEGAVGRDAIADCWASEDFAEGRAAFSEHREPRFRDHCFRDH